MQHTYSKVCDNEDLEAKVLRKKLYCKNSSSIKGRMF